MQIPSLSVASLFKEMQALLSPSQVSRGSKTSSAGQDLPSAANLTAASTASAAPSFLGSTPSQQFSSDLLATLISAQAAPPSASSVAGKLISNLDANGDGTLSLSEIENALSNGASAQTASAATASLTSGFNKIDANGDGQISQTELATALQTLVQDAQSLGGPRHHHHHHPAGDGDQAQAQAQTQTQTQTQAQAQAQAGSGIGSTTSASTASAAPAAGGAATDASPAGAATSVLV